MIHEYNERCTQWGLYSVNHRGDKQTNKGWNVSYLEKWGDNVNSNSSRRGFGLVLDSWGGSRPVLALSTASEAMRGKGLAAATVVLFPCRGREDIKQD